MRLTETKLHISIIVFIFFIYLFGSILFLYTRKHVDICITKPKDLSMVTQFTLCRRDRLTHEYPMHKKLIERLMETGQGSMNTSYKLLITTE